MNTRVRDNPNSRRPDISPAGGKCGAAFPPRPIGGTATGRTCDRETVAMQANAATIKRLEADVPTKPACDCVPAANR